jgi:hypothetical protein
MSAAHGKSAQPAASTRHSVQAGALLAFVAGIVFAFGLVISGMTQPVKVQAFLDFSGMVDGAFPGRWDPTLAFVMGGAVVVSLLAYHFTPRPGASVCPPPARLIAVWCWVRLCLGWDGVWQGIAPARHWLLCSRAAGMPCGFAAPCWWAWGVRGCGCAVPLRDDPAGCAAYCSGPVKS